MIGGKGVSFFRPATSPFLMQGNLLNAEVCTKSFQRRKKMKKIFGFSLIALLGLCIVTQGQSFSAETVLVVFPSDKAISHAPFFVADKMGYFDQEGLRMEFTTIPGGLEPLKAVATGKAQMAFPAPSSLIVARESNLPVRSIFALRQKWIFGFASMQGRNIKTMADLKGKTIGVISESAGFIAKIMIVGSKDLSLDKVNIQVVGANMAGPLAAGRVDAVYCWDTLFEQYKRQGLDVVWISGPEYDDYQSNVLATSEQFIKEKPKMIQGFLRGIVKGSVFSIENPQAALKIISKSEPQLTKDMEKAMVELQLANAGFQSKLQAQNGFGFHSAKSWELQAKALKDMKEITKVLPGDQYFTNEFIALANKIDQKNVKQDAMDYK
jgi:NitT/TauT family transport system substrate-binding protein